MESKIQQSGNAAHSPREFPIPLAQDVPGVDLGRASSGFTRVLLVPNGTAKIPPKPGPQSAPGVPTYNQRKLGKP